LTGEAQVLRPRTPCLIETNTLLMFVTLAAPRGDLPTRQRQVSPRKTPVGAHPKGGSHHYCAEHQMPYIERVELAR
jgi:hypothetical protein